MGFPFKILEFAMQALCNDHVISEFRGSVWNIEEVYRPFFGFNCRIMYETKQG